MSTRWENIVSPIIYGPLIRSSIGGKKNELFNILLIFLHLTESEIIDLNILTLSYNY